MSANEELIHTLYRAFQRKDGAAMAACYHPDATFRDEVFTLRGKQVGAMWRMLCEGAKDGRSRVFANKAQSEAMSEVFADIRRSLLEQRSHPSRRGNGGAHPR